MCNLRFSADMFATLVANMVMPITSCKFNITVFEEKFWISMLIFYLILKCCAKVNAKNLWVLRCDCLFPHSLALSPLIMEVCTERNSIIVQNQQKTCLKISLEVEIVAVHIKHRTPHDFLHNEIKIAILLSNERLPCSAGEFATEKHFRKHQTESIHEKFIRRSEGYETRTLWQSLSQLHSLISWSKTQANISR